MNEGQELKEAGIALVESNNTDFIREMRSCAVDLYHRCYNYGFLAVETTTDDLREFADILGIKPNSPNAWGAIFKKAPDGYRFINTGRRKASTYPSNHGRQITIFRVERI
jgi:hypothetical protein